MFSASRRAPETKLIIMFSDRRRSIFDFSKLNDNVPAYETNTTLRKRIDHMKSTIVRHDDIR